MSVQADIDRRLRLQEFFKSDPTIWDDVIEELSISHHNESTRLKSRDAANRDWSAGWVAAHEYVMDMRRYFVKQWTPNQQTSTLQGQQKT